MRCLGAFSRSHDVAILDARLVMHVAVIRRTTFDCIHGAARLDAIAAMIMAMLG
jgi:hypothetical protein